MTELDIPDFDSRRLAQILSGETRQEGRNRRIYSVTFKVRFEADTRPADWDDMVMNVYVKRRAAQVLQAVLEDENDDWFITVICDAKLLEKRSLFDEKKK